METEARDAPTASPVTRHFTPANSPEELTIQPAEGLRTVLDAPPCTITPITHSIDLDAVTRLFTDSASKNDTDILEISFIHEGVYVQITADGTITFKKHF